MKKAFLMLVSCVMCASLTMLTACNTVNGAGKDISSVGHEISKAS